MPRLFGLEAEVLAQSERGDGRHRVLKVDHAGRTLVIKLYGRKRDALRDTLRDVGQRWFVGKTGMPPAVRARTELATIELWHRHGFGVPAPIDVDLPPEVPKLRLVYEFVPGQLMHFFCESAILPLAEKERVLGELAREWGRRHALALELREPRLVQAHATLAHVIRRPPEPGRPERFVTYDFEVAWARRSAVARLVSLEIAQCLDSLARRAPAEQVAPLLAAIVRSYPDRSRLERLSRDVRNGRLPLFAPIARMGLWLRERGPARMLETLALLERALRAHP